MNNLQFTIYNRIGIILFIVYCSLSIGTPVLAQAPKATEYQLLAPIPLTGSGAVDTKASTATYIPGLFRLMIALATGLAVIRLIYAGIIYMSTDAINGKEDAKGIIETTLWGLLLAIGAWVIINTINPKLLDFNLNITPQPIDTSTQNILGTGAGGLQQSTTNAVAGLRTMCSNCTIQITSTTGDSHDPKSLHYQGLAVDIGADANLTKFLTGQTTNPQACATYLKTLNGVSAQFKWEPKGETCGGAVASTGDHWHMSVTQ
jgi:hypothetical protein